MKKVPKTEDTIRVEIDALKALKPKVRRHNAFGDDHREAIDAQITVLEGRLSLEKIYDTWGDEDMEEFAQNVLYAAIEARDWMTGDLADDEGKPSDGWAELAA